LKVIIAIIEISIPNFPICSKNSRRMENNPSGFNICILHLRSELMKSLSEDIYLQPWLLRVWALPYLLLASFGALIDFGK